VLDLLVPTTDAGVLIQAVIVGSVLILLLAVTWRRGEWRLVSIGLTILAIGFFGVRALH